MSRIRTIKPEFFTSEDIVSLTPLSRLFYVSLWCEADREGRLSWNTRTLKLRYFPADDCDIDTMAQELIAAKLIELYEVDGRLYAQIPSFAKHQVINNREAQSTIPARVKDASTRVQGEGRKEGKGKEGKGREHASSSDDLFFKFYEAYPRKVGKEEARKAFEKRKPSQELLQTMLKALEWQKEQDSWKKDDGKFIPHPASWLNAARWEDEPAGASPEPDDWKNHPFFRGGI